jgi:hypothetical protein
MPDYWHSLKTLNDFRLDSISQEDLSHVRTRIILLNTKADGVSTYLVTASPITAKEKVSHQGLVVSTWPEVVIGILSETEDDGNQGSGKSWAVRPTRKDGKGWRKNSIMRVRGREYAARLLLGWWAEQNDLGGTK